GMAIRRLVLDVLKPIRGTSIVDLAERISKLDGVEGVNISVTDMDVETMGLMIIIEGTSLNFDDIRKMLEEEGCAIHSIDEVVSGNRIIEGKIKDDL
uniref:SSO6206 n=1 Tax=Saccharolobus solfataricus (strain ATCC 35092 / DSM 1617 / JCM 11322 / P2) TaxID=273057 RepID=UPI0001DD20F5|nr:Chain A, SSO6206 [Saccharolobus solfataricus P2]2X3D_B Chain B, SSO6206 [Saccharolobus solfataricus P2]2X3D_C Chain C, SSO6206 [Saccharolobus solfataricus P2]2X3D_D Chain D, SSO6206 [Saccharolobus solfataricus P2]2X3D_E Chain E, SSO6206 [Saccharolobus solfataricus P2]2X3D_F Chain F, SSO6206 [Saccharolobus solfataricus P2]2X3D_G Chain G, SSO6206 [Saccharolobus solfataricus P2]2X3D_H Chain H, SSO6206 [Saccharolobus solfataricus P2]